MAKRVCRWCKIEKDETEFHWEHAGIDRVKVCKECRKVQSKRYRDKSEKKRYEYNKKYTAEHRDSVLDYLRNYYRTHKEETKKRIEKNRDRINKWNSEYYAQNKEQRKKDKNLWMQAHPEKASEYNKRHLARKRGAEISDITIKQWRVILKEYDNKCAYCGTSGDNLEQDHVVPVSKGGNDTKSNIVPACKPCNSSKKDKLLEDWKRTHYFKTHCKKSRL